MNERDRERLTRVIYYGAWGLVFTFVALLCLIGVIRVGIARDTFVALVCAAVGVAALTGALLCFSALNKK